MKKFLILVIIILIAIIIGSMAILISRLVNMEKDSLDGVIDYMPGEDKVQDENIQQQAIKIFSGDSRPIAVTIDNVQEGRPQAGLNKAYMVYEMVVEGGLTRLMALYKDVKLDTIGPIRSSRHYFLDYVLENDAIHVHWGR